MHAFLFLNFDAGTMVISSEAETQVMDYQTQQFKLLPLLATAYAMSLAGHTITKMYDKFLAEAGQGKFDSLPEVSMC